MGAAREVSRGDPNGRRRARQNPPAADTWSDWQRLDPMPALTPAVLREILDGGQAFRWQPVATTEWLGMWANTCTRVRLDDSGRLEWSGPADRHAETEAAVRHYFGCDADFAAATDALPWRSDAHLAACIAAFPGLRILRQPFGETLLCFLCSATKQIVQIKQMVALLAERFGDPIGRVPATPSAAPRPEDVGRVIHALPDWNRIAELPESDLRQCLLGFRARYIAETARFLAAHPGWLEETEHLPYAQAKPRLCELPGVGEKVADCVLLFGAGRLEAFPVDVWILKTMAHRYGLHGWKPAQLTQFGRVHFGPLAGLAQQFLFAWERMAAKQ